MKERPMGYVVVCEDYTSRWQPTREAAEHWLAQVVKLGICQEAHEIIERRQP